MNTITLIDRIETTVQAELIKVNYLGIGYQVQPGFFYTYVLACCSVSACWDAVTYCFIENLWRLSATPAGVGICCRFRYDSIKNFIMILKRKCLGNLQLKGEGNPACARYL